MKCPAPHELAQLDVQPGTLPASVNDGANTVDGVTGGDLGAVDPEQQEI